MYNAEVIEKINEAANELFPNLQLDFMKNIRGGQFDIFTGHIIITSSLSIDRSEIIYSNIFDESKLKNILKERVKNALMKLKNLIQNDLDKLGEKYLSTSKFALEQLLKIKQAADGGTSLISNQGQPLDGYSELANYRAIIEKFNKEKSDE